MTVPVPPVVLHVLAWWLFWHAPVAQPYDPPPFWGWDGRVITREDLHVGIRPHSDALQDVAVTIQVTFRAGSWW